jgi:membrane protein DedA with SNARE-associated domain
MDNIEPFETIYEVMEMLVSKYGALGIAAAMFAESAGVPFASAVVLLTSGTMILRGTVSFWSIFLASTIGITLGSIFSYIIGLLSSMVGSKVRNNLANNRCNYPDNDNGDLKPRSRITKLWDRYGNFSIFMAQLWGVSRTFISYPAGAMHMNFYVFIIYTFLGGSIFSLAAIALSVALTGTMGLTIKVLKQVADLSPWLLTIPAAAILAAAYLYMRRYNKVCYLRIVGALGNLRKKIGGRS